MLDKLSTVAHLLKAHHPSTMLPRIGNFLLQRWYKSLHLQQHSPASWYLDRYHEEIAELHDARTRMEKLSETSDVLWMWKRGQYDGCPVGNLPPAVASPGFLVYAYMVLKLTSRWGFFMALAFLCGAPKPGMVREVVNAGKDHKLDQVAGRHGIDPVAFRRVGRRLRWVWPLLP